MASNMKTDAEDPNIATLREALAHATIPYTERGNELARRATAALSALASTLADASAVNDRICTILDEAVSMMPVMPAQEALTLLEEHVHSLRMAVEIAQQREPTQAEGDAHARKPDGSLADECFVPAGGWTGRRCRVCNRWVWGGPTACVQCADLEATLAERGRRIAGLEQRLLAAGLQMLRGFAAEAGAPQTPEDEQHRSQFMAVIRAAESWQRLQWRPASEAPMDTTVLVILPLGVVTDGTRLPDDRWIASGALLQKGTVLGWLPLDVLPALNGGDDNG